MKATYRRSTLNLPVSPPAVVIDWCHAPNPLWLELLVAEDYPISDISGEICKLSSKSTKGCPDGQVVSRGRTNSRVQRTSVGSVAASLIQFVYVVCQYYSTARPVFRLPVEVNRPGVASKV